MASLGLGIRLCGFVLTTYDDASVAVLQKMHADSFSQGRMGTSISNDPTAAFAAFGLLNFGKGVGNVLSGPISGALLGSSHVDVRNYGVGRYKSVILFTGSCMALSGAIIALSYLRLLKGGRSRSAR